MDAATDEFILRTANHHHKFSSTKEPEQIELKVLEELFMAIDGIEVSHSTPHTIKDEHDGTSDIPV